MASASGQSGPSLNRLVDEQYGRFDVFQLVRLLRHGEGRAWPVGQRLSFRADLRANFPGQEITGLAPAAAMASFRYAARRADAAAARIELRTPNYCIASELGPLPEPFLEWVRDQERMGAHAMAAFFNLFNQRIHVLRHELRQRSLRGLDAAPPAQTRYAGFLGALMGVALPAQQRQVPLPLRALLGLSGLLVNRRKSPVVVEQVLAAYLGVAVRVRTLVGMWRDIEASDLIASGRRNHALGRSSLLGRRTWDARAAVAIEIARMPFDACCALLPLRPARAGESLPMAAHHGLVAMIRLLLDRRFDCEVGIAIAPGSVPPSRLVAGSVGAPGLRLGQTAWLGLYQGRPVRFRVAAFDPRASA